MGFDFDWASFAGSPMVVAAPRPVFGALDETTLDGVAMRVAEFFGELALGEDVEVVVTVLPEAWAVSPKTL